MKRIITIEVETDSDEPLAALKRDVKQELHCCCAFFDLDNMSISERYVEGECFLEKMKQRSD